MVSSEGQRSRSRGLAQALVLALVIHLITSSLMVQTVWKDETTTTLDQMRSEFLAPIDTVLQDSNNSQNSFSQKPVHNASSVEPQPSLLTCHGIRNLKIVDKLGKGKRKRAFSVRLPSGEIVVAKRCRTAKCYREQLTQFEGTTFKKLFQQHGSKALKFYGECKGKRLNLTALEKHPKKYIGKLQDNFKVHYTFLVEFATPLLEGWHTNGSWVDPDCFAQHYTEADVADLASIAHRYASLDEPLYMGPTDITRTDNIFPQQYVTTHTASGEVSSIQHSDLDLMVSCKDHGPNKCTYDAALDYNCRIISKLVNRTLDCSDAASTKLQEHRSGGAPRINTTLAALSCLKEKGYKPT